MIESIEAQKIISRHRRDAVVIATYTTNREWPQVSTNPDFDLLFAGGMGKASSLGLGLAMARPDLKVIVLDGDGSLLMNLGSLVTIANIAPPNLVHFVFENGVYRTSGCQPIPGASKIHFAGLAENSGYAHVHEFEDLDSLEKDIGRIMGQGGPTFVCLQIVRSTDRCLLSYTRTNFSIISRFRQTIENTFHG